VADRILVVNDEKVCCEIISSILTLAGYQCRTASDGLDALAVLNSGEEFELLIANLNMPSLDGIGLLIRTKEQFPDMPVVIETATNYVYFALEAIRNGAYDYIVGHFEREQLLIVVRRALEYRRLKLENPSASAQEKADLLAVAHYLIGHLSYSQVPVLAKRHKVEAKKDFWSSKSARKVTEQAPVPVHAPLQPAKLDPLPGLSVKVTTVPLAKFAVQVAPQLMPAGLLVTVPVPVPASVTVSGEMIVLNVAVTEAAALIVTEQAPVPVHATLKPANVDPLPGLSVKVTTVPLAKFAVRTVVWQESAGDRRPYADQTPL
jgi:CheY-like chemotaxis protein